MTQPFGDDPEAIPGSKALRKAIVRAYDSGAHTADVQIVGSHPTLIPAVRVATDIPAADVVAGRQCTVLFHDPSNQDDAVVITIQGANPSTPSGATVAASGTVVTETAFGQAAAAGAASPYSRGDHTHGTPADPVTAHAAISGAHHTSFVQADADALYETIDAVSDHEALADPHTVYGALAQAETWVLLQTFSAGIKLAAGQAIKDSGGADRYTPAASSPQNTLTGDLTITGQMGLDRPVNANAMLDVGNIGNGFITATTTVIAHTQPWEINANSIGFTGFGFFGQTIGTQTKTGLSVYGLRFEPTVYGGGSLTEFQALRLRIAPSGVLVTNAAYIHGLAPAVTPSAGSGAIRFLNIPDMGHANFATVEGIRIANQTGSPTARLIEALGLTTTNLRLEAGDPPDAASATEGDSAVLLAWMENGTVNLRRVRWRQQSSLGATDKVLIAA